MFLLKAPMQGLYEMNLFFSPMTFRFKALICHRKLTVILIPVGEREGDDVIPGMGYVEIHAIGRLGGKAVHRRSRGRGHFDGNLAEVLGEEHC